MNRIAIALSDERLLKLQQVANDLNVLIEELVLIGIENLLAQKEVSSQNTTQNILNKKAGISPSLKLLQKFCTLQYHFKCVTAYVKLQLACRGFSISYNQD